MTHVVALIPCKALAGGKSRLASALDAVARADLCRVLLSRTIALATALGRDIQPVLVTSDPGAAALGAEAGIAVEADLELGLNAALSASRDARLAERPGRALLVMPIDLPLATADAVLRLMTGPEEVRLACDEAGTGTNLLYLSSRVADAFRFAFGPGSAAAHRAEAKRLGRAFRSVRDARLSFDLDRPEDLRRLGPDELLGRFAR